MLNFITNMFIMGKINEVKVSEYVTKGYITQIEAGIILATPQIEG